MRNVYTISVRKLEGKRPLEIPRHRGEDSIRMDLWEIGWEDGSEYGTAAGSCDTDLNLWVA
jgi:hypothetical protein